jgi:hypothetical protein
MSDSGEAKLGTLSTLSIGIGGMVGGGIFAPITRPTSLRRHRRAHRGQRG